MVSKGNKLNTLDFDEYLSMIERKYEPIEDSRQIDSHIDDKESNHPYQYNASSNKR